MPSSVYFRSALPTADSHLSAEDFKPDLYHTTDWDAFGRERSGGGGALDAVGQIVYKMEVDNSYKEGRLVTETSM